jgi:hypothetical protein
VKDDFEIIDGEPFLNLPLENEVAMEGIKETLKSTRRPY